MLFPRAAFSVGESSSVKTNMGILQTGVATFGKKIQELKIWY